MRGTEITGWADANTFHKLLKFRPAGKFEVGEKQQPVGILRIGRVYNKPLKNYWWHSTRKQKHWIKVKVTVEEVRDGDEGC